MEFAAAMFGALIATIIYEFIASCIEKRRIRLWLKKYEAGLRDYYYNLYLDRTDQGINPTSPSAASEEK